MDGRHGTLVQLAVAMLGVIAAGGVAFGAFLVVLAPGAGSELQDSVRTPAALITAMAGVATIAFGALAGVTARLVWIARPVGRTIAYGIAIVVILAPLVAILSGGGHPALIASVLLGVGLVACLLLEPTPAPT